MSEAPAMYRTTPTAGPLPTNLPVVETPLSPRAKALVIGLRRVLLLAADVLAEYAGLPKRGD